MHGSKMQKHIKTKGVKLKPKKYNVPTRYNNDDHIETIIYLGILAFGCLAGFLLSLI